MSKTSGLGWRYFVAGVDLSGDTSALNAVGGGLAALQPVTGIDKLAFERRGLTRDGRLEWTAYFNPTRAHPTLSALPTADQPLTVAVGTAIGDPAASMVGKQINYDGTENEDKSFTLAVQALANGYGLDWGRMLTPGIAQISAAGAQAGLDYGATVGTTLFGLQAFLHVFAFTGTDATIAVQHSDDDGSVDPWADVTNGVFAQVTSGPGSQRLQTNRDESIKRWLRVNVSTVGGFTDLQFAVAVSRNLQEVLF